MERRQDDMGGKFHIRALTVWLAVLAVPIQAPLAAATASVTVTAVPVATGLNYPAMFTVAPDGRIWYSERTTGRVGIFSPADGSDRTYFQVPDLCSTGDQGLYGLALSPEFPADPHVFAYATRRLADGNCYNQVLGLQGSPSAASMDVLASDRWVGVHIGGRLLFGPDGDLYVSTGDGSSGLPTLDASKAQRASAQDLTSLKGKILRLNPDGSTPTGNPFGNAVFAYGFRNVFGFDFDPSGRLWAADNGPDPEYPGDPRGPGPAGGCNDELDLVVPASNYGWGPTGSCATPPDPPINSNLDGPNPVGPAHNIQAASGITAARFCVGCGLGPDYDGRLFWGKYSYVQGQGQIHAATLSADGASIGSDTVAYIPPGDPPLAIERGPDGTLYYSDRHAIYKLVSISGGTTTTTVPTTTTTTTPPANAVALVTSFTPSYLRNDFSGWVGMNFTVGSAPLTATALGRYVANGNSATHTVKLVDASTGVDVAGGAASVDAAGAPSGQFRYANLPAPVTLAAGHTYYLASAEVAGGDTWYDYDTHLVTSPGATSVGAAYATPGGSWVAGGNAGNGFGPPNLLAM